jgi:hypothetical protein
MADDPKAWIALTTSGLALAGTLFNTFAGEWLASRRDKRDAEKIVSRFRDPLMHAAYDLQSRLYNILKQDFLGRYFVHGTPREKDYAIENTTFVLAQFLGWIEAIREGVQFLDLGEADQTRELRNLQDGIFTLLRSDNNGPGFRLFAGEQRAVGELMLERGRDGRRCMGFASFSSNRPAVLDHWLDPVREDIRQMALDLAPFRPRLVSVQHALIDLLEFLDPEYVRFPRATRSKV